jgi:hypothetical protein
MPSQPFRRRHHEAPVFQLEADLALPAGPRRAGAPQPPRERGPLRALAPDA